MNAGKLVLPLLLLLTFFHSGCEKEELTKETQEGLNTFSCKINGKVFLPKQAPGLAPPFYAIVEPDSSGYRLVVFAYSHEKLPFRQVFVHVKNFQGVGTYQFYKLEKYGAYKESSPTTYTDYFTSYTNNGSVTITRDDRSARIVSGTFEFTAAVYFNSNDQVTITHGRFDAKY